MSDFKPLAIILCLLALPVLSLAQDELIIISPHPEGIETEFGKNFEKWYETETGRTVKTDWRDVGGTSSNYRFIESEFKNACRMVLALISSLVVVLTTTSAFQIWDGCTLISFLEHNLSR